MRARALPALSPGDWWAAWLKVWDDVGASVDETTRMKLLYPKPKTRADCAEVERPCPYVSCRHHLYLEVHEETGVIKFNHGQIEIDEMPETCSLDVAERDGVTLDQAGRYLGLTRERIRQIEANGIVAIRELAPDLDDED